MMVLKVFTYPWHCYHIVTHQWKLPFSVCPVFLSLPPWFINLNTFFYLFLPHLRYMNMSVLQMSCLHPLTLTSKVCIIVCNAGYCYHWYFSMSVFQQMTFGTWEALIVNMEISVLTIICQMGMSANIFAVAVNLATLFNIWIHFYQI